MSDYRVAHDVSRHLRQLLFDGLAGSEDVTDDFTAVTNISLASPAQISAEGGDPQSPVLLSLYLYQVQPNPHARRAMIVAAPGEQRHPPLSLDLSYLLTPLSGSAEDNLVILGRAMQILDANTIVRARFLDSDLRPPVPQVEVRMDPVSLEELTRIWNAFNEPYQLSVCYQVQYVAIDSVRLPDEGPPVEEAHFDVHEAAVGAGLVP